MLASLLMIRILETPRETRQTGDNAMQSRSCERNLSRPSCKCRAEAAMSAAMQDCRRHETASTARLQGARGQFRRCPMSERCRGANPRDSEFRAADRDRPTPKTATTSLRIAQALDIADQIAKEPRSDFRPTVRAFGRRCAVRKVCRCSGVKPQARDTRGGGGPSGAGRLDDFQSFNQLHTGTAAKAFKRDSDLASAWHRPARAQNMVACPQ